MSYKKEKLFEIDQLGQVLFPIRLLQRNRNCLHSYVHNPPLHTHTHISREIFLLICKLICICSIRASHTYTNFHMYTQTHTQIQSRHIQLVLHNQCLK